MAEEHDAKLICSDMVPDLSAACRDNAHGSVRMPRVDSPEFGDYLANVCLDHEIGLIVPTIDTELLPLAMLRNHFECKGTTIAVSSPELVAIARDKRKTAKHFSNFGITSPEVFPNNAPRYPAIAKPSDGSLSRDIHVLWSEQDYSSRVRAVSNLMVMEYLDPREHEEYTCDAYYDSRERLACVVPRLRLEVRGGEVSKGRTVRNNIIKLFEERLYALPGARGCLTFQFFRNRTTGALHLIEVNARFGGGFPLSLAAGANYPAWLYEEWVLRGPIPVFPMWKSGLTMLRFDSEVFVQDNVSEF